MLTFVIQFEYYEKIQNRFNRDFYCAFADCFDFIVSTKWRL